EMPYMIRVENDPQKATAPAQLVEIVDTLPAELDASTLRFDEIGVAGRRITLGADGTGTNGTLKAEAHYDAATRQLRFRVYGIGTGTGQDAYADFLPPNVSSPEGQGY